MVFHRLDFILINLIFTDANNGNLRNYIKDNTLSYKRKMEIAINIANGIMFLHMKGIVHENLVSNMI